MGERESTSLSLVSMQVLLVWNYYFLFYLFLLVVKYRDQGISPRHKELHVIFSLLSFCVLHAHRKFSITAPNILMKIIVEDSVHSYLLSNYNQLKWYVYWGDIPCMTRSE